MMLDPCGTVTAAVDDSFSGRPGMAHDAGDELSGRTERTSTVHSSPVDLIDLDQLEHMVRIAGSSSTVRTTLLEQRYAYQAHASRLTATAQRASEHRRAAAARRRAAIVAAMVGGHPTGDSP